MSKPLKPTEEQVRAIVALLYPGEILGQTFDGEESPRALATRDRVSATWNLIRDEVLEAAAAECQAVAIAANLVLSEFSPAVTAAIAAQKAAERCRDNVRAMKGKP